MKITVLRGQNQIGGNIIEIATETTRILLDVGCELDDEPGALPLIEGLFDSRGYDAVFISHYHRDHLGLAYQLYKGIPLFIGENSYKIIKASDEYKVVETITPAGFMIHGKPIHIRDMIVTPFLCDHSAFDSYMLHVEANGETVLYTGDFRSNGRKPFNWLMQQLPRKVDTLLCEGTTLSRPNTINETEQDLEHKSVSLFSKTDAPVFVLQSSMNIDRIVTMYRAAKQTRRLFLQDLYMAEITTAIGGIIPNPVSFADVKTFVTRGYKLEHFRYKLFQKYGPKRIGKVQIIKTRFVMCVRPSMLMYMKSLSEKMSFSGGLLIYSIWSGYREKDDVKIFLASCMDMGLEIVTLHTSGHADPATIRELIRYVNPKKIIPVHTENARWFDLEYEEKV